MMKELKTERLRLRPLKSTDLDFVVALNADPEVMKFIRAPQTADESKAALDRYLDYMEKNPGLGFWAIEVSDEIAKGPIGWVGVFHIALDAKEKYIELGYRLVKSAWGKGYATEAGKELVRYSEQDLELPILTGLTHPENLASQRVLVKNGFTLYDVRPYYGQDLNFFVRRIQSRHGWT